MKLAFLEVVDAFLGLRWLEKGVFFLLIPFVVIIYFITLVPILLYVGIRKYL